MRHHAGERDVLIGAALNKPGLCTLRDAVDAVIDPQPGYIRRHPSCVERWFARGHGALDETVRTFEESQAGRFWHFLAWAAGNKLFEVARRRGATDEAPGQWVLTRAQGRQRA
ncbi:hypothetical protein [Streptomyces sp. NK08204]|uniref:hypothetical protein n=1 Tax=Streptomyces sp. NK08204 TaxID=2873260 RepID=UPI001CEC8A00|nr:hypothetical protein [Streptomyces sp. NK08204]